MPANVEKILRPHIDAAGIDVAAMIEIDRRKGIIFCQHISDAITMAGLNRSQCGAVIGPGARILGAGVPLRLLSP